MNVRQGATSFNQDLSTWTVYDFIPCFGFADGATAWLEQYGVGSPPSIANQNPPLSQTMIDAGCGVVLT